jgi:hypothetical protein
MSRRRWRRPACRVLALCLVVAGCGLQHACEGGLPRRAWSREMSDAVDAPDAMEPALPARDAELGDGVMTPFSPAVGTAAPPMTAQRPASTNQVSLHSALVNSARHGANIVGTTQRKAEARLCRNRFSGL